MKPLPIIDYQPDFVQLPKSRFLRELDGELGEFWRKKATEELEAVENDLAAGNITIDEAGVARNCIGRALMDDMLEKVRMLTDKVDADATKAARAKEVVEILAVYRENRVAPSQEDLLEMRAAFGAGTTAVDILTGSRIEL